MWAPRTWAEIEGLIGQAAETGSLDFKREFGKGEEIAKDIAAMTINGGVLVYGVDEDQDTRLATDVKKFPLGGVEEKMQQVVGSRIAPACEVEVVPITENDEDTDGVVTVIVPPSSMAPHQVARRYPRRVGTTTDYLEEPEVARLYERRRELAAICSVATCGRRLPGSRARPSWAASAECGWWFDRRRPRWCIPPARGCSTPCMPRTSEQWRGSCRGSCRPLDRSSWSC